MTSAVSRSVPDTGSCRITQRYCYVYSFRRTRTLPQDWTIFSSLLLLCFHIPSLPWLATVWTYYSLGTQGRSWRLKPVFLQTRNGDAERIYMWEPHRVLLGFRSNTYWDRLWGGWPKQGWRWGLLKHHNSICYLLRILYEPGTIINAILAMPHWILTIH